jgi:adenylosuccinate synthase
MIAKIVIGSLFGDEGKGITTDFLCNYKQHRSFKPIVVRFSGGQQAGHNVKIGNLSHVHSNFGSGALRGVPSYFSEHCTFYPVTMMRELSVLLPKVNQQPEIYVHPLAMLTTAADVAYNKWIEKKLGHGSCGLGVGSTMKRNLETPYKLYAIDLLNKDVLRQKYKAIVNYYTDLIGDDVFYFNQYHDKEFDYFNNIIKNFNNDIIRPYSFLNEYDNIIFEGSQGIMLDKEHGIFPNVTYANTTSKNALKICKKLKINDIEIFYVTRCYQTRHGIGWMSNETLIPLINTQDEINIYNEWQKDFRIGEIDYDLLNYAYSIDDIYSEGIPKNLVITCLDQRPDFEFDYNRLNIKFKKIYNSYSADSETFKIK